MLLIVAFAMPPAAFSKRHTIAKRTHQVWANLCTHMESTDDLPVALSELEGQDLINGLGMSRPPRVTTGTLANTPSGITTARP